jgi:hypothetical protein
VRLSLQGTTRWNKPQRKNNKNVAIFNLYFKYDDITSGHEQRHQELYQSTDFYLWCIFVDEKML